MAIIPPVVLLKPEGSRDTNGPITPTLTRIAVTSGQYGQAWVQMPPDWEEASISTPAPFPADARKGTIIMRLLRTSVGASYWASINSPTYEWEAGMVVPGHFYMYTGDDEWADEVEVPFGPGAFAALAWDTSDEGLVFVSNTATTPIDLSGISAPSSYEGLLQWTFSYSGGSDYVESIAYYDAALTPEQITAIATMPESWTWENLHIALPPPPPAPRFGGLAWSVPLHGDIAMHVEAPDTGIAVHREMPTDTIAALHEPGADGIRVIQKVEDFS